MSPRSKRSRLVSLFPVKRHLEYSKIFKAKNSLVEKKAENEMVLSEFKFMENSASVFKLVGPILAKLDVKEAQMNVEKRIEFIGKEILRMETLETDFQSKVTEKKQNIMRLQEDYKRIVAVIQQAAQQQQQQTAQ
jgi:prefoldin beta subunit